MSIGGQIIDIWGVYARELSNFLIWKKIESLSLGLIPDYSRLVFLEWNHRFDFWEIWKRGGSDNSSSTDIQ